MVSEAQYITDESGKTSVLVPLSEWEALKNEAQTARRELEILTGLKEAFDEVKESRRTGKKLPLVRDWLANGGLD